MTGIERTNFSSQPAWLAANNHQAESTAATARIVDGKAEIHWALPPSAAFNGRAETTLNVSAGSRTVPVTLSLADGPTLRLLYADHTPPIAFKDFRVYVSGPGLV